MSVSRAIVLPDPQQRAVLLALDCGFFFFFSLASRALQQLFLTTNFPLSHTLSRVRSLALLFIGTWGSLLSPLSALLSCLTYT